MSNIYTMLATIFMNHSAFVKIHSLTKISYFTHLMCNYIAYITNTNNQANILENIDANYPVYQMAICIVFIM